MKTVEIHLPYFKQGDDLRSFLEIEKDNHKALIKHGEMLHAASVQLNKIAGHIADCKTGDIEIEADTHMIIINGPNEVIDRLISEDLADKPFFEDDEDIEEIEEENK